MAVNPRAPIACRLLLILGLAGTATGGAAAQQVARAPAMAAPRAQRPNAVDTVSADTVSVDTVSADSAFVTHARELLAIHGIPAGGVSVVGAGGPAWTLAWSGTAAAPPEAATPFPAGPLTELLTRAALFYLDATGRLAMDGALTGVLEDLRLRPPHELAVVEGGTGRARVGFLPDLTARMLVEHRAGLPVDAPRGTRSAAPPVRSYLEVVAALHGLRLVRAPGEAGGPSRAGLAALAAAIELATGTPFATFVRERLLEPVGMRGTTILPEPPDAPPVAGWRRTGDALLHPASPVPRGAAAALGLVAPVADAGRLATALLPFPEAASTGAAPAALAAAGGAFPASELDGIPARLHVASGGGASTAVLLLPDSALGAVVLLPVEGSAGLAERLVRTALRMELAARSGAAPLAPPRTDSVSLEMALQLVGSYRGRAHELELLLGPGGLAVELPQRAAVRQRGDTLWVDDPALPLEPIVPLGGGELLLRGDTLVRQPYVPPRSAPPGWRGLVGEYGSAADALGVHETGSGLRLRIDARTEHRLSPEGEDVFLLTGPGPYAGERIHFLRGPAGSATTAELAGIRFPRLIPGDGGTFRIRPRRAIHLLRRDALAAAPPQERGEFLPVELVELRSLDATILYDIRYATVNNFMGAVFYTDALAFLQRPAAEALTRVNARLRPLGYGLLVHDAYRPWHVTKMFWDATPDELRDFVADPASGSRHNRGAAVDLTLYDLATGAPVEMPSGYDEFTSRAHADYPGGEAAQRWHRALLRHAMAAEGFAVYDMEWWHFDYADWRRWPIGNVPFLELMTR